MKCGSFFILGTTHFEPKPIMLDVKENFMMSIYIWNCDCLQVFGWRGSILPYPYKVLCALLLKTELYLFHIFLLFTLHLFDRSLIEQPIFCLVFLKCHQVLNLLYTFVCYCALSLFWDWSRDHFVLFCYLLVCWVHH